MWSLAMGPHMPGTPPARMRRLQAPRARVAGLWVEPRMQEVPLLGSGAGGDGARRRVAGVVLLHLDLDRGRQQAAEQRQLRAAAVGR